MQDEISEKVIALCINGGKISARILKENLRAHFANDLILPSVTSILDNWMPFPESFFKLC